MAEKFTQPTVGRAVFAAVLARLMGQPRFDRLRGDVAGASLCRPQGYADTGSSFAGGYWRSTVSARLRCAPAPRVLRCV
jgi:hypothetical protein